MTDQDAVGCECKDHERTALDRPEIFLPLIVLMLASFGFLLAVANRSFGVQLGSLIPYTCLIVLGTFSAQRGQQPYFFECVIVRSTMESLVRRHIIFLVGMVLTETIAFQVSHYLPASWLVAKGRDGSPFAITLFILCLCLAFAQILSNRSRLERAHRKRSILL